MFFKYFTIRTIFFFFEGGGYFFCCSSVFLVVARENTIFLRVLCHFLRFCLVFLREKNYFPTDSVAFPEAFLGFP